MQEFMLLIRKATDQPTPFSPERREVFLQECKVYIDALMEAGKLKSAQPLLRQGAIISGSAGAWKDGPFNETKEVIAGYYHILAKDLDEAIAIAKGNPEFAYDATARIEVRPIKMMEASTGFVYPTHE